MEKKGKSSEWVILIFLLIILGFSSVLLIFQILPLPTNDALRLPPPDLVGYLPLSTAIHQSKTTIDLNNRLLQIKEVSQILWALQGITHGINKRTVPSAGATYPLEIFFIHKGSPTLNEGLYNYLPQEHELKHLSLFNWTKIASSFLGEDQEAIYNVSTVFLVFADYSRTTGRYGKKGVQYVHLEVGHAIQNFLLQLTSLNLNSRIIASFDSQNLQDCINTTLDPMVVLPVGVSGGLNSFILKYTKNRTNYTKGMTIEEAIVKRKSTRDYLDGNIPLEVILDIMNDSVNIPYLSNGNLHLDLKLVVGGVNDLIPGSYQFFIQNNSLRQLSIGDSRSALREAGLNQRWIENAQLDIVISVNTTWINEQPDPTLFHRIMMYNIGMLAQNVYLKCASYGLGTVVVGALNIGQTSQVIDLPTTHTPIYIIPIGLTPEFYEEEREDLIPSTELARLCGLLSYIPFYTSLYLSLPVLKRRMTKKMRWIHCIIGSIPIMGVIFHFLVIHGHVQDFLDFLDINTYLSAIARFITRIVLFPETQYDIGIFLANLNILLGIIVLGTGILLVFKLVRQKKLVKRIHKYSIFLIIIFMIIHALLNRTMFINKPLIFLSLNIILITLFFLLYISPTITKDIFKKQEDLTSVSKEE